MSSVLILVLWQVKILGKCEFANPSGSIKDRIADHILTTAEQEGKLKPGGTVVAATSGNTGASVAMIAAMKGYHYIGRHHSACCLACCPGVCVDTYGVQVLQSNLPVGCCCRRLSLTLSRVFSHCYSASLIVAAAVVNARHSSFA